MQSATNINLTNRVMPASLLTVAEAARQLRVSESYLNKARVRGDGPPYAKLGKAIRYRADVLDQWIGGRERISTTDEIRRLN